MDYAEKKEKEWTLKGKFLDGSPAFAHYILKPPSEAVK